MSQVWRDGRSPKVTCTARNKMGNLCKRPPIKGSNVCRTHGGAAPQVRAAAQVRILMASDMAAAQLVRLMTSSKVDDRVKLAAARDLLDRANLAGTQNVEIGLTPKKTFEDFVGESLIDIGELAASTDDTVVAEIVAGDEGDEQEGEDDDERWDREDAQRERAAELRRMKQGAPLPSKPALDSGERLAEEAELLRDAARSHGAPSASGRGPIRKTSTADPYADRTGTTRGGRSMSPKRWQNRHPGQG